ncbi:MAG: prepilin-type N-terminal cleavage/methylation domain-containing protein [Coriobacteriales bacterium]|nr:prepilin-type N-terminal cleavage/methylation domain-containing protein [Coriobacteriales bacterium]
MDTATAGRAVRRPQKQGGGGGSLPFLARKCPAKHLHGTQRGFTLVEIIVSFAILAVVATAVVAAVLGMAGIEQRDEQVRADNAAVEERIASGQTPTQSLEGVSIPLGGYDIPAAADTYGSDTGSYTVLNGGAIADPAVETLDGNLVGPQNSEKSYRIFKTGYYQLEVWGGAGYVYNVSDYGLGCTGGYATGVVKLTAGDTLYLYAGGRGSLESGGANGGGDSEDSYGYYGGGGGGASDVRINSVSLSARVIVAGGGGGNGMNAGGFGGGATGMPRYNYEPSYDGEAGTQSAGGAGGDDTGMGDNGAAESGSFGQGGQSDKSGGGGGGGWYGGGGGLYNGGGGGSGWTYTAAAYAGWSDTAPEKEDYKLTSRYYLTQDSLIAGNASMPDPRNPGSYMQGMRDAGYVRVTWVGTTPTG